MLASRALNRSKKSAFTSSQGGKGVNGSEKGVNGSRMDQNVKLCF